ncbi:hypothetical protein [Micromonospora parathelypteridis]|uniref:Uncharacterized protein n=1 Tax=Micromonospora parathelypteridis TaxID=1839617 RepID=A0A840VMV1_9ACTN|nr:hypothetical protein [Micromonospora parathelypteridis]MBB5478047.1 hypothetical protein [Micromonospora parathelypteridis]GGO13115.1 hypothetical protein GCM10011576_22890 [Micromonospora parathelypteridis]
MRDADNIPRTQYPNNDRPRRPGSLFEAGGQVGGQSINERSYRRMPEQAEVARAPSHPAERARDEDEPGFVIHLPIRVPNLTAATVLAGRVAVSLGFLPELDAGETTVSNADDQNNRHRVFCDLLLPDRSRCPQGYEHEGLCGEVPAAPEQRPASRPASGP